jgi:glycerol uptake facilitator-like aquaporin
MNELSWWIPVAFTFMGGLIAGLIVNILFS